MNIFNVKYPIRNKKSGFSKKGSVEVLVRTQNYTSKDEDKTGGGYFFICYSLFLISYFPGFLQLIMSLTSEIQKLLHTCLQFKIK
jgi:hypothetical protein